MTFYLLVHNDTGRRQSPGYEPWGTVISRHRTMSGAEHAFRVRNRHLFDKDYAKRMGMANAGTFDEIVTVEDGKVKE